MLRPGTIAERYDGVVVRLVGRNGCDRSMWWGWPIINGRVRRGKMCIVLESGRYAVKTDQGFQYAIM